MSQRDLETRVQHLEDIHQIKNLMSKYEYFYTAGLYAEMEMLFALKSPGVRAEHVGGGIYDGPEGIHRLYVDLPKARNTDHVGVMSVHTLTTPVIEIAGDGKTAKAVWISPGAGTIKTGEGPKANWNWTRYGVDFIKEDGKWKIWHLAAFALFFAPYEKSWVNTDEVPFMADPDELKADRPSTYHNPYTPTSVMENVPAPPEPYETWDESTSYVK